ncbi:MAG: AMP-binding protein, partial [Candidatus Dormibacteraeota bacterium]|nr:AMP-binding protein [Candidatus Dormibacteraeota bacterium]
HLGAERLGCTVIPTSAGVTQRQVLLMRDLGSTVLTCTPSYALVLAEAAQAPPRPNGLSLRVGIHGAEPWSEGMRAQLRAGLGLEPYDIYGLTELGGPGVAIECSQHRGLHIFEDHFLAEVVDPDSGQRLPDGEVGELVITSLTRQAAPVLRYRTGDRTQLSSEACPCGNPFRRFLRIQGRTDDMLVIRGENVFPSQIEEVLLRVVGLSGNYQLVVDREKGRLDTLEVRVEVMASTDSGDLGQTAEQALKETIGLAVQVTVLPPQSLPRSEGKARRVVDRRELR